MGIVDKGLGEDGIDEICVHGVGGVDENNSAALVQFSPNGTEFGMAEVMVVGTVAGVEGYTVCF